MVGAKSGHVRPRQGTEICNFVAPSPRFSVQVSQEIRFPGGAKMYNPVTSLAVMILSVPTKCFLPACPGDRLVDMLASAVHIWVFLKGGLAKSHCNTWKMYDAMGFSYALIWKGGKDPHPQDKIQRLDFTKDPQPLYYKTPPCVFYHKNVRSKAVFGP